VSDGEGGVMPPADPATTGKIMKFAVDLPLDTSVPDATVGMGTPLRPAIMPLEQDGATRNLVLFEGLDEYGRLQPLLGTLDEGSLAWFEPISENPMVDDVEVWEIYNATEDAHPIHLHLVTFQILNRESFEGFVEEKDQLQHSGEYGVGGKLIVTSLGGDARGPEDNEAGWKDTAVMLPGEVTRVIARFDRGGRYVWHCHILSHEDHEMMRPFYVGPMPMASRGTPKTADDEPMVDPTAAAGQKAPGFFALGQNYPNPFNPTTRITFELPAADYAVLRVFDVKGRLVKTLAEGSFSAGLHVLDWDGKDNSGRNLATGIYFYRLKSGILTETRRMVVIR
jgi:spore coat protein A